MQALLFGGAAPDAVRQRPKTRGNRRRLYVKRISTIEAFSVTPPGNVTGSNFSSDHCRSCSTVAYFGFETCPRSRPGAEVLALPVRL